MGGSSSKSDSWSNTSTNQNMGPWAPQQGYLTQLFQNAQNTYNQNAATGPYQGDYVAAPNSNQYDQNQRAIDFANGPGANAVSTQLGTGSQLIGSGINTSNTATSGLEGAANQNLGDTISGANQVASGFDVPGAVKAAMMSANQEAADNTLPSLYRGAAAGGNINSDRTAIASGVIGRGLAEQAANLDAQLRNQNYQTGLSTALSQNQQRIGANTNLGYLGQGMTSEGINDINSGFGNEATGAALGSGGANADQQLQQSILNNQMAKFNGQNNYGYNNLHNLLSLIGGSYGSSGWSNQFTQGSQTQQQNPSILSTIGSGIGAIGSLI